MKKVFAVLLAVVLLISVAGCQNTEPNLQPPEFAPLTMTPGQTHSEYDGMEIQIDSLNWHEEEGKTSLVVVWNNQTGHDVIYGAGYTIERLEGEEWVSCAMRDDVSFIAIAYELKAGRLKNESYNLTGLYDVSLPGIYRFRTSCYVYEHDAGVPCELIAEFTGGADHSHQIIEEAQIVEDPITGYCGNIQTTLYIGEKTYTFMYGSSVTLTDILVNLNYDPMRVCRCAPEYVVDTEFGTGYGINLTQGYARCEKGQANLTQEQIDAIAQIIAWAETTNGEYDFNNS